MYTCAVVTFNDGSKRHYTDVKRGGLAMSSRGARIALTMLDGSVQYLENSNSVMMVDDEWLADHQVLISPDPDAEREPTPGPWWVDVTGAVVAGEPEDFHVIADTHVSNVPEQQRAANAEVMAHALQLKELLQQIVERSRQDESLRSRIPAELLQQSEQALAELEL
jgi:hypothetical protein